MKSNVSLHLFGQRNIIHTTERVVYRNAHALGSNDTRGSLKPSDINALLSSLLVNSHPTDTMSDLLAAFWAMRDLYIVTILPAVTITGLQKLANITSHSRQLSDRPTQTSNVQLPLDLPPAVPHQLTITAPVHYKVAIPRQYTFLDLSLLNIRYRRSEIIMAAIVALIALPIISLILTSSLRLRNRKLRTTILTLKENQEREVRHYQRQYLRAMENMTTLSDGHAILSETREYVEAILDRAIKHFDTEIEMRDAVILDLKARIDICEASGFASSQMNAQPAQTTNQARELVPKVENSRKELRKALDAEPKGLSSRKSLAELMAGNESEEKDGRQSRSIGSLLNPSSQEVKMEINGTSQRPTHLMNKAEIRQDPYNSESSKQDTFSEPEVENASVEEGLQKRRRRRRQRRRPKEPTV